MREIDQEVIDLFEMILREETDGKVSTVSLRGRDSLDFHEIHVLDLFRVMKRAYALGSAPDVFETAPKTF